MHLNITACCRNHDDEELGDVMRWGRWTKCQSEERDIPFEVGGISRQNT